MNIFVDLDDSFLSTDVFLEATAKLLGKNPLLLFKMIGWIFYGRAYCKFQVIERAKLNYDLLPVRLKIYQFISDLNVPGNSIFLITGSPHFVAEHFKAKHSVFKDSWGSTQDHNLTGKNKLLKILAVTEDQPFMYIGDSSVDLPIWSRSDAVVAVNPSRSVKKILVKNGKSPVFFLDPSRRLRSFFKLLRPHQWSKNVLILLPVVAAHSSFDLQLIMTLLLGFVAFCLLASSIYIMNDLIDLAHDRDHHTKKNRPFAAGELSILWGFAALAVMMSLSLLLSYSLGFSYFLLVLGYIVLNLFYSLWMKSMVILDIIFLSFMYTIRILAGGVLANVLISEWLLSFSTFFFFSLASIKRYTELSRAAKSEITGRGYYPTDLSAIYSMGMSAGFISMLVFCLYLKSSQVEVLYVHYRLLWFVLPILIYWISRIWLFAKRNLVHDDPVIFALKDPASWVCLLLLICTMALATQNVF